MNDFKSYIDLLTTIICLITALSGLAGTNKIVVVIKVKSKSRKKKNKRK